jgi:hypothetical protein
MQRLLVSVALIFGLLVPIGAIHDQTTNQVTATCKDGTTFTGTKRTGACRGHGGGQSWGAAAASPAAASPSQAAPSTAAAPAGTDQVRVSTTSKVYHSPGTRYYGKAKQGEYMSEAQAKAAGDRPAYGKGCGS